MDHRNHDTLKNTRDNLRPCTNSENHMNRKPREDTFSKFKGVHWLKNRKKWLSRIQNGDKRIHIGYFLDEIEAAKAYNKKALELFGEFAFLNVI